MKNIHSYLGYFIALKFCLDAFVMRTVGCSSNATEGSTEVNFNDTTLRFVSVLFRHGDRTLDDDAKIIYPNNPYKDYNDYPNSNGLLTEAGKRRAYKFGQMLRRRYSSFLGDVYYPPNVYARSTAVPRTKMTLQLVLAALFPPVDNRQNWNSKLIWQPVDTIYSHAAQDGLLFPFICEKYADTYIKLLRSKEVVAQIKAYDNLMKDLSKPVGRDLTTIYDLFVLYHILAIQLQMNLTLPEWSRDIFPRGRLFDATVLQYELYNYNDNLISLNGGILLRKIIQDMVKVANGALMHGKINLFSAHDVNVIALLRTLGTSDNDFPAFTSGVIVELHEKDGEYFVHVLHYLGIPPILTPVRIYDCDLFCPLQKFVLLTSARTAKLVDDPTCPQ